MSHSEVCVHNRPAQHCGDSVMLHSFCGVTGPYIAFRKLNTIPCTYLTHHRKRLLKSWPR